MCYDIKMANMKLSKSSVRSCNKIMPYPTNVKQLCIRWLLCTVLVLFELLVFEKEGNCPILFSALW